MEFVPALHQVGGGSRVVVLQQDPGVGRRVPTESNRTAINHTLEEPAREGLIQSRWEALQGQLVLGTAEFVKRIKHQLQGNRREQTSLRRMDHRPTVREIIALVEQLKERPWMEFRDEHGNWGRDLALYLGRRRGGLKLRELADTAGGIDYVSVGMAIKRFEQRLVQDKRLTQRVQIAENKLTAGEL